MGLFFKKRKEEKMDVPPPPPADEEAYAQGIVAEEETGELPELPALEEEGGHIESEMPEIKPKKEGYKMPEFPEAAEEASWKEEPAPRAEEMPVQAERAAEKHVGSIIAGSKFLSISNFQTINEESESIRQSLKQANDSLKSFEEMKKQEELVFEKWRQELEDAEKKLNYVDRVIFKGE